MIIYKSDKREFLNSVFDSSITHKIYDVFRERIGKTSPSEIKSWSESMVEMAKVVDSKLIHNNASIAVEFNIPLTSNLSLIHI